MHGLIAYKLGGGGGGGGGDGIISWGDSLFFFLFFLVYQFTILAKDQSLNGSVFEVLVAETTV